MEEEGRAERNWNNKREKKERCEENDDEGLKGRYRSERSGKQATTFKPLLAVPAPTCN